jgi:O-antigen/teichoic acid export membrane protein
VFNWQIDKFLIARFWGAKEAAVYAVGALFCNVYLQLTTTVVHLFIPKATRIVAQKQGDNLLTDLLIKTGRIQFLIGAYMLFFFIFFGPGIVLFYAGKGYETAYYIGLLLIIPLVLPLSMNLATHILRAKAKHKIQSVIYVLVAFLNLLVSIPLCKFYGEIGAALGTFIGMVAANNIIQIIYIQKISGLDVKRWFKEIFSICRSLVVPGIIGIFIVEFVDILFIPAFLGSAIFFTISYVGSAWCFGMKVEEKLAISIPIRVILKKMSKNKDKVTSPKFFNRERD